jgi:hypothetical protein
LYLLIGLGYDKWREKEMSDFYDDKTLRKRIRDIRWMMTSNDLFNLMFRLRGGLARDAYGIQNEGLFTRALAGTKYLIEDYHNTVCQALDYICDTDQDEVSSLASLHSDAPHSAHRSQRMPNSRSLMKLDTLLEGQLSCSLVELLLVITIPALLKNSLIMISFLELLVEPLLDHSLSQ